MTPGGYIALAILGAGAILLATNSEASIMQVPDAVNAWQALADKYAQIYTILDPEEILAIIWNESSGNPQGSNPGDPSWGLMGVTRLIAEAYGGSAATDTSWHTDPDKNVKAGAGFLADLKNKYALQFPAEWVDAYNEGETAFRKGLRVPDYRNAFFAHLNAIKRNEA
jgi:soluble lytic murein transglycosylase-like protein